MDLFPRRWKFARNFALRINFRALRCFSWNCAKINTIFFEFWWFLSILGIPEFREMFILLLSGKSAPSPGMFYLGNNSIIAGHSRNILPPPSPPEHVQFSVVTLKNEQIRLKLSECSILLLRGESCTIL